MKNLLFLAIFFLMTTLSYGQYDCKLIVTNMTGSPIEVATQLTNATPNICPAPISGDAFTPVIPIGGTFELIIATVPDGDPPVYPYRIGAALLGGVSATWKINDCWNPACMDGDGPLTILVTSCGGTETHITVF